MGHLGSKSRSLGQIADEPCICSRSCTFIAIWSSYSGDMVSEQLGPLENISVQHFILLIVPIVIHDFFHFQCFLLALLCPSNI